MTDGGTGGWSRTGAAKQDNCRNGSETSHLGKGVTNKERQKTGMNFFLLDWNYTYCENSWFSISSRSQNVSAVLSFNNCRV